MTTIYQSNFDSDTAGSLSAGWSNKTGSWVVTNSGAVDGANAFGSSTKADGDVALYVGAAARADMQIETKQKLVLGSNSRLPIIGHILRSDSANANNYTIVFSQMGATGGNAILFKKVAGTYTQLTGFPVSFAAQSVGSVLHIKSKVVGNTISLYVGPDGALPSTPSATWTDSSISAAGYPGLYYALDLSSPVTMSIDDFVLDDAGVADTVAPTAVSAAVANSTPSVVAITMSEAMDPAFVPPASDYAVDGHAVSSVSITGPVIYLTCSTAFVNGEPARTVSYTGSGTSNARDVAGNLLANFAGLAITNNVAAPGDTTPPTFVSAQVLNSARNVIVVTMSENLGPVTPPVASLTPSGRTVTSVSAPSGATFNVTVDSPYAAGDNIMLAYTKPASNQLQDVAGNQAASFAAQPVTNNIQASNNALANGTANVMFSPYNWDIGASSAKTINAGAYFKTIFGGTTCTLNFDMTGVANPLPQLSYRVDRFGPWITVPIAASVAITIPVDTADYASKGGHLLEVLVKSMTETQARWSTQSTAVKLTSIVLDIGKTLRAPPALLLKGIFYGDSITEGVRTVNMNAANDTDRNDAGQGWSMEAARILGAEVGNVGFGATGFNTAGSGGVPSLPNTYGYLYAGVARSFASSPDFIVLMHGTNDGGDVTANATTVLNGLIAATTAKIIVLRPFNGAAHATQLQAAIAACTNPARCTYVDTAGWFVTANSSDNLHPYGIENITHIAPLAAAAIKSALNSAPVTTGRTFSVQLDIADGVRAANLTGLKIRCYNMDGSLCYSSDAGTSDAGGNVTVVAQSTAMVGASCLMTVRSTDHHYSNFVQVA